MSEHLPKSFDPTTLVDEVRRLSGAKNDAALARLLGVGREVISKVRHRVLPVGASLLIAMHEVSGLSIKELRCLMGDRRRYWRISSNNNHTKGDVTDNIKGLK